MGSSASSHASQQGQGNGRNSSSRSSNNNNVVSSNNNISSVNSNSNQITRSESRASSRSGRGGSSRNAESNANQRQQSQQQQLQLQHQRRAPPGLEALQDAQNLSSGTGAHLYLNRPYPMMQRTETAGTAVGFTTSPTAFESEIGAPTDWVNSNPGDFPEEVASDLNSDFVTPPGAPSASGANTNLKPSQIMRRVHSSGGSPAIADLNVNVNVGVGVNVSHNYLSSSTRRVTSQSRVAGMTVITGDSKIPAVYSVGSGAGVSPSSGAPSLTSVNNSSNAPTMDTQNAPAVVCLNPASEINSRLDTQVEVKVYPCNNNGNTSGKKKFTQFTVKPEGVIIQGTNRRSDYDLGSEYARHIGRKLQRYELADTRACQLLVTSHAKSFWVVPAPEAFSRHSGTCRLLGDRKHSATPHTLQVGDFLRVGSVGVVVIETHDGMQQKSLSEERIQKIMKDTASGGFIDLGETDGENSEASNDDLKDNKADENADGNDVPVCYMCFDESDDDENPLITPCKCLGDTRYVHVECLRKWHTAEADNQICFLSSVDATCSVCKSTFKSDFKLRNGKLVKLFKSSLEPPYVSLLIATKHEMAQRLFNTRFQLSFNTILKADRKNGTRPLLMGRSSGSDMVLDYRTVSARHASIRFKNGEFIFNDAGSSNGSYLYLRRPVELTTSSQSVQFRLGRSMISMKVVNKWNRRLLRAVRRTHSSSSAHTAATDGDDHSIGSEEEINITDELTGTTVRSTRRTRESIMQSLPPVGGLSQTSPQHLDLLHALAYPKKNHVDIAAERKKLLLKRTTEINTHNTVNEESKREVTSQDIPALGANTNNNSYEQGRDITSPVLKVTNAS